MRRMWFVTHLCIALFSRRTITARRLLQISIQINTDLTTISPPAFRKALPGAPDFQTHCMVSIGHLQPAHAIAAAIHDNGRGRMPDVMTLDIRLRHLQRRIATDLYGIVKLPQAAIAARRCLHCVAKREGQSK
jgi:hypothetical protein